VKLADEKSASVERGGCPCLVACKRVTSKDGSVGNRTSPGLPGSRHAMAGWQGLIPRRQLWSSSWADATTSELRETGVARCWKGVTGVWGPVANSG
jgi:hypothetical protein